MTINIQATLSCISFQSKLEVVLFFECSRRVRYVASHSMNKNYRVVIFPMWARHMLVFLSVYDLTIIKIINHLTYEIHHEKEHHYISIFLEYSRVGLPWHICYKALRYNSSVLDESEYIYNVVYWTVWHECNDAVS